MKLNIKLLKKVVAIVGFMGLGVFMGILLTTTPSLAKFTLPKVAYLKGLVSTQADKQNEAIDTTAEKKQKLEALYKDLMEAESKDDWQKLYTVVNPADKKWLSIEDMTLLYKKDKYSVVSKEVIVHGISVLDDTGNVDNTIISCKTKACNGEDKLEKRDNDEFVYIDGQWYQQSIKEPSEKARQLAAYIYADYKTREKDRKMLADKYGGGEDDLRKIIKTISTMLENDPEYLAYTEAWVEKHKAESSRANVYVDSPDVIQQPVVQQQQPSFNNRLNCTSSTIGNYTYTNCY